jgi:hypothetical protein
VLAPEKTLSEYAMNYNAEKEIGGETLDGVVDDMLFVIQQKSIANRMTPLQEAKTQR